MTDAVQLECSRSAFDRLFLTVNKAKNGGTETIRVKVADLEALLVDHGRLLRACPHKFSDGSK